MATEIQTCYRHDDRRAGVVCQRCDRPICPACMQQASVGFHCPECAAVGRQQVYTAARLRRLQRPYITLGLIAISVVVFVLDMVFTVDIRFRDGIGTVGALSWEGQLYGPNVAVGDWWRPVTVGFVHGSLMHIGFNMLVLYLLGERLEPVLGRITFLVLYVMSLLGGSALILLISPTPPTVGASGAIFGLLGAAVVGMWIRGVDPFGTPIGMLLVIGLVMTVAGLVPGFNISVAGHVGGLLAGAAGGLLVFGLGDRMKGGHVLATALCAVAAAGLFLWCLEIPPAPPPWEVFPSAF